VSPGACTPAASVSESGESACSRVRLVMRRRRRRRASGVMARWRVGRGVMNKCRHEPAELFGRSGQSPFCVSSFVHLTTLRRWTVTVASSPERSGRPLLQHANQFCRVARIRPTTPPSNDKRHGCTAESPHQRGLKPALQAQSDSFTPSDFAALTSAASSEARRRPSRMQSSRYVASYAVRLCFSADRSTVAR